MKPRGYFRGEGGFMVRNVLGSEMRGRNMGWGSIDLDWGKGSRVGFGGRV